MCPARVSSILPAGLVPRWGTHQLHKGLQSVQVTSVSCSQGQTRQQNICHGIGLLLGRQWRQGPLSCSEAPSTHRIRTVRAGSPLPV